MESKKKSQNCSKNIKKSIKKFFLQIFRDYKGGVGGSDQIWKIPDFIYFFFEPFPNPKVKNKTNMQF